MKTINVYGDYLTRTATANELGLHPNTLDTYNAYCQVVPDYVRSISSHGNVLQRLPYSPYRRWVISQFKVLRQQLNSLMLAHLELQTNPENYSLLTYQQNHVPICK